MESLRIYFCREKALAFIQHNFCQKKSSKVLSISRVPTLRVHWESWGSRVQNLTPFSSHHLRNTVLFPTWGYPNIKFLWTLICSKSSREVKCIDHVLVLTVPFRVPSRQWTRAQLLHILANKWTTAGTCAFYEQGSSWLWSDLHF